MHAHRRWLEGGRLKTVVCALGLLTLAAVGLIDHLTGPVVSFSIFYLIPVSLVTWYGNRPLGLLMAVCSAALWLALDLLGHSYAGPAIAYWNAGVRLGFFVTVSVLLADLKSAHRGLEETVRQRTASLATEVEEHRRTVKALHASENQYRVLYTSMNEGMALYEMISDADGNAVDYVVLDVNPAFEVLTGLSRERVIGRRGSELYGVTPPPHLEIHARVASTGEPAKFETTFDPARKTFRISAFSPEPGRCAAVFEDITERELGRRELLRKNRDLETLLYVSSHDLREPLRGIQSFAHLLNDRYAERLDEKGRDFLQRVIRGGERMDRLMEDLLMMSRAYRTIDPRDGVAGAVIVREAMEGLRNRIETTGAGIRVAEGFPVFLVDRAWAIRAVQNLIANALKFTRVGERPDIEIAPYRSDDGRAEAGIIVRDRGPGIPVQYSERIFELFQRAVPRSVEGTGAGLAIVRQVAERHGGRVWVQPREGGGAEFIITFESAETTQRR